MIQKERTMGRSSVILILAGGVLFAGLFMATAGQKKTGVKTEKKSAAKGDTVSFKKNVMPVLKKYCLPCHTEDEMNPSELYLDSYDNVMAGGKHGKSVLPGKADSSLLIRKLSLKPPFGDPMPLKRKTPFNADTLKMLKNWIDQGAKKN